MNILAKLCLTGVSLSIALGITCAWFDRYCSRMINGDGRFMAQLHELGYIGFLKIATLIIFATLAILPLWGISMAVSAFDDLIIMGDQLAFTIFAIIAWLSLSSLAAFLFSLRRFSQSKPIYMVATSDMEPELHKLSRDLARQFRTMPIENIHLTPDSTLRIYEDIHTLDHVFYGGAKTWEIGLAALQYLSAADLKVLMAKEYAYYTYSRDSSGLFAVRLNQRLSAMSKKVQEGGLFLMLNPLAWLIILTNSAIRLITKESSSFNETRSQQFVTKMFGENRLYQAITRHAVEAEVYKDIIPGPSIRREPGQPELENIYYYMRLGRGPAMAESRAIAEAMLFGNISGKSRPGIKLRRPPEMTYYKPFYERPASVYLANNRKTETRMMELVNYGQSFVD